MNFEALQRLARDEGGNLTPMFALILLPVLGLVGITVDYSQSSARKAMLDSIADSGCACRGDAGDAGVERSGLSQRCHYFFQ